jgi:hypothetical protein
MRRRQKVVKLSARVLLADTTTMFSEGFMYSSQTTKADVIQDFPTPRKAWMTRLVGPNWRK